MVQNVFQRVEKKYKGIVYKRRIAMPYAEAYQYLYERKNPGLDSQIFREINYFKMRYELQPEMYLAYDRLALFGKEDPEFRVTFDKNIRSRKHDPVLLNDTDTIPLLEKGYHLMEVKIAGAVPLWFAVLLSEEKIYPVSFSKYGNVYLNQLAAKNFSRTLIVLPMLVCVVLLVVNGNLGTSVAIVEFLDAIRCRNGNLTIVCGRKDVDSIGEL